MTGCDSYRFVVGFRLCLATLCSDTRRVGTTGGVQEDGQRVHTDRPSEQCIFAEKALTALLQPTLPSTILPAATSSRPYREQQEY